MAVNFLLKTPAQLLCLLLTTSIWADERPLNIYIGAGQMPFASTDPLNAGLFGDLMQQLCASMQRRCEFKSVPWKRLERTLAKDDHALALNVAYTPERREHFKWMLHVWSSEYVLLSTQKAYSSLPEAMQDGPIAVMAGTPRAEQAQALKTTDQYVAEIKDPQQAALMLESQRVNSWYEINARAHYLWRQLGFAPKALIAGPTLISSRSYIVASPHLKDAAALQSAMQSHFAKMQQDGSWQTIVSHYLGPDALLTTQYSAPDP